MTAFPLRRRYLPISAGLLSLCFASCKSTQGSKPGYADVVDYTTPNTSLSQEEYPFDKDGNYLADVVSGKKKGKPGRESSWDSPPSEPDPTPAAASYRDTYEKPVITAVDTPSTRPNPIYDRVPEPDSAGSSSSSSNGMTGGGGGGGSASSSATKPRSSASSSTASKSKTTKSTTSSRSTASTSKSAPKSSSGSSKAKSRTSTASASKTKPKPKAPSSLTYTVKRGDTLYGLASRYGTSVAAIKQANGLSSNTLRDGRTLRIPRK